eukprot:1178927-Prorocentrum_minimum.AAC.5
MIGMLLLVLMLSDAKTKPLKCILAVIGTGGPVGGAIVILAIGAVVLYSVMSAAGAVAHSAALGGSSPLLPPLKVEVAHNLPDSPPPGAAGGAKVVPHNV